MKHYSWPALLLVVILSCHAPGRKATAVIAKTDSPAVRVAPVDTLPARPPSSYRFEGNQVIVMPFDFEIVLSPKAQARMAEGHETIIVDVSLDGMPRDSSKVELSEDGSFNLASVRKEIRYGDTARFDHLTFPRKWYDQLADTDAEISVNVFSGRKSTKDNLLDVEFLSAKISSVVRRHITLRGKLIYGDD